MNRFTLLVLVPVLLTTMGSYCDSDILDDPGFQLWCGDELCAWSLEEGAIQRVPTWHEHDYAVNLVGPSVVLSQRAVESFSCVRLELIVDIDPSVTVTVEIDYGGDGSADSVTPISGEGFQSIAWDVHASSLQTVDSIFYVRKVGEGRAVLTQLRAAEECERGY